MRRIARDPGVFPDASPERGFTGEAGRKVKAVAIVKGEPRPQPLRRVEDQVPRLFLAGSPSLTDTAAASIPGPVEVLVGEQDADDVTFLFDSGSAEALLVAGAAIRSIPRGEGGEELVARAVAGAAAWRRERARERRQLQLAEHLIAYAEQLNASQSEAAVYESLLKHTLTIVGGFSAVLLLRRPGETVLRPFETSLLPPAVGEMAVKYHPRFRHPGLISEADARPHTGSPLPGLAPLFAATGAVAVAHVPFAQDGCLFVVERRQTRVFEPESWELLRVLTAQAQVALQRIHLFQETRELSLTDPLTGLGNRRHMEIMLEHALAAARRGEPLAVVMLDLDGFKTVNDERGHLGGDRILRLVAACIREQIRGSDVAVRYGGDEFLLILPGGDAPGAAVLIHRIRERLEGQVEMSAGCAVYGPDVRTAEQLIEAADTELYAAKRIQAARRGRDRESSGVRQGHHVSALYCASPTPHAQSETRSAPHPGSQAPANRDLGR